METSKMESTDIRQVEALLQAQLNNVAEESDKVRLIAMIDAMIDNYFSLLKRTQSLPVLHRLKFFDCTYIVFCFLHLNGQLRRHKTQFDEACINDLNQMFRRLYGRL